MPTIAELDRLEALMKRLAPLTSVQRGELIRADDWNVVVSALAEVTQTILAREAAGAVSVHEHVDQVNIGWLDPRLRSLVEKGPLGEPTAISRLDSITRRLDQETVRVEKLQATAREARNIASDIAVREEKRDTDVKDLKRDIDAVPDAREDVIAVRETLLVLQDDIRQAIEIGGKLVVDGEPFDAAAWDQRLGSIEELRERLTSPDGTVLDASALERRLTELINTFVTQGELDDVISKRPVNLTEDQRAVLETNLGNSLNQRFSAEIATTAGTLRGEMAAGFGGIDATISGAIADARIDITESAANAVRDEIGASVAEGRAQLRTELMATLDQRLAAAAGDAGRLFDERATGLEAALSSRLFERLASDIGAAVDPLRADVSRLTTSINANTEAVTRLDRQQVESSARIEAVSREADAARKSIEASLRSDMDKRLQDLSTSFDGRLTVLEKGILDRVSVAVQDATRSLRSDLEQTAAAAAQREAQLMATQLRNELTKLARDEVAVIVSEALRSSTGTTAPRTSTTLNPATTLNPTTTLTPGTTLNPGTITGLGR